MEDNPQEITVSGGSGASGGPNRGGVYVPSGLDALLGPTGLSEGVEDGDTGRQGWGGRAVHVAVLPRRPDAGKLTIHTTSPGPRSIGAATAAARKEVVSDYSLHGGNGGPVLRISGMRGRLMPLAISSGGAEGSVRTSVDATGISRAEAGREDQQLVYRVDWLADGPEEDRGESDEPESAKEEGFILSLSPSSSPAHSLAVALGTIADLTGPASGAARVSVGAGRSVGAGVSVGSGRRRSDGGLSGTQEALLQGLVKTAAQEAPSTRFDWRRKDEKRGPVKGDLSRSSIAISDISVSPLAAAAAATVAATAAPVVVPRGSDGVFGSRSVGGASFVPRLVPEPAVPPGPPGPYHLVPCPKGSLDSLVPVPLIKPVVAPGNPLPLPSETLLVAVKAVGINFRDVLNVSGAILRFPHGIAFSVLIGEFIA